MNKVDFVLDRIGAASDVICRLQAIDRVLAGWVWDQAEVELIGHIRQELAKATAQAIEASELLRELGRKVSE